MECVHGRLLLPQQLVSYFGTVDRIPGVVSFALKKIVTFSKKPSPRKENGYPHPMCHTRHRLAKMRMVKDKMKLSFGRQFFVCSERESPYLFWQWTGITESLKPICQRSLTCRVREVRKDRPDPLEDWYGWGEYIDPPRASCRYRYLGLFCF